MNERTLRLHLKIIRLARGILNCWQSWVIDEAEERGYVAVVQDGDPHKIINKSSAQTGPS